MTRKILLGGIAALALSAGTALPAAAQDYDDYGTYGSQYYHHYYDTDYTMPLRNMNDAADRIDNVAVETSSGTFAGSVRDVRTDYYGKPTRIGIALRDGGWVWVKAAQLSYDPRRDVVRTSLSYGELEAMGI